MKIHNFHRFDDLSVNIFLFEKNLLWLEKINTGKKSADMVEYKVSES